MPQFNVYFRDPQNPKRANPKPVPYEGDDPQSLVQQIMVHEGQTPVWVQPIGAPQGAPQASQAPSKAPLASGTGLTSGTAPRGQIPRPSAGLGMSPDNRAALYGMAGQLGLPALVGAATGGVGTLPAMLLGGAGGLIGSGIGRRGLPSPGDVASTVAGEVAPQVLEKAALPALRAVTSKGGKAMATLAGKGAGAVSAAATRMGVDLSAWQRFPGLLTEWMEHSIGLPAGSVGEQMGQAGRAVLNVARQAGGIIKNPEQQAARLLKSTNGIITRLTKSPDPKLQASGASALADIYTTFGEPLHKLTAPKLMKAIRQTPLRVKNLVSVLATATGKPLTTINREITRLWFSDVLHGAVRVPTLGSSGAMRIASGMADLDGRAVVDAWKALKADQHIAFGDLAKGMKDVVDIIGRIPEQDRARISMRPLLTAIAKGSPLPLMAFIAGEHLMPRDTIGAFESHKGVLLASAAAAGAGLTGLAMGRSLVTHFMASKPGQKIIASWLDMTSRGMAHTMIEESLGRLIGRGVAGGVPTPQGGSAPNPMMPGLPPLGPNTALAQ